MRPKYLALMLLYWYVFPKQFKKHLTLLSLPIGKFLYHLYQVLISATKSYKSVCTCSLARICTISKVCRFLDRALHATIRASCSTSLLAHLALLAYLITVCSNLDHQSTK